MAVIYLKHELHGSKVAISEEEAVADEKNGWVRFDLFSMPPPPQSDIARPRQRRERVVT